MKSHSQRDLDRVRSLTEEQIVDLITDEILAAWILQPSSYKIGLYPEIKLDHGPSGVGMEIDPEERAVAVVSCLANGNSQWVSEDFWTRDYPAWREDFLAWGGKEISGEDDPAPVYEDAVRYGVAEGETGEIMEDLARQLFESAQS